MQGNEKVPPVGAQQVDNAPQCHALADGQEGEHLLGDEHRAGEGAQYGQKHQSGHHRLQYPIRRVLPLEETLCPPPVEEVVEHESK